jgi:uncharacterized damage-inducible protein DinB
MDDTLLELFAHQAWADAEHWRALDAFPAALEDNTIAKRLHHLHFVQRAFLSVWRGEPFQKTSLKDFPSMAALRDHARRYHKDVAVFLPTAGPRLEEPVLIPWIQDPPCRVTLRQSMLQAVMHSHYHRAQNATRLRERGGTPPITDLIVWLWKGSPPPEWP